MALRQVVVDLDGVALTGGRARDDKGEGRGAMRADRDVMTGAGRDAASIRGDRSGALDSTHICARRRAPDAVPGVVDVPGDEHASAWAPIDDVPAIANSEPIRIPSRAQIGLDEPLKAQPSRAIRRVPESILDDDARLAIRTELKTIDLDVFQHLAIGKSIGMRVRDHFRAFRERDFPAGLDIRDSCLEPVDEFDRRQPQSSHLAAHMPTHVGEVSILSADQVGPIAGGDIGLLPGSSVIADAGGRDLRIARRCRERGQDNKHPIRGKDRPFHPGDR